VDATIRRELLARARFGRKEKVSGTEGVVVSSHPVVSRVGADVLRGGGNAVDAVVAAAVAQTVVEPHMTTIFGVYSMLHWEAATGETTYLNGSMNAPLEPLTLAPGDLAGGKGVAVPGFWAGVEASLERFGTKAKSELVAPAIALAREGFEVYPFLYAMLFGQANNLGRTEETRELFLPGGGLIAPGELLVQHRLADTLEALVERGNEHFYRSAFTQRVVDTVTEAGGVLTMEDFDRYHARWVEPGWSTYRGHRFAVSPPPDTGGTHVAEILNLVELVPLDEWGSWLESPDTLYWLLRFCGEVFADGARYGDPNSHPIPLDTILSKQYAQTRFELMQMGTTLDRAVPGAYPGSNHLTVVDRDGNVATVLHSVMSHAWTNGLYVDGVQIWAGGAHLLRKMPEPGDRGTCYVAPTILFGQDDRPLLAAGSPSVGLIQNLVQNTINIIDFGKDVEASVHEPRFGGQAIENFQLGGPPRYYCETDVPAELRAEVERRGVRLHEVGPWNWHSGSYEGIHLLPDGRAEACADPRRAGQAEAA